MIVVNGDSMLAVGGTRAGSTLTMAQALKNLLSFTERPLADILPLLTENPARLLKVYDRIGSIAEGKDADLVILDEKCDVERTFAKGRLVFAAGDVG